MSDRVGDRRSFLAVAGLTMLGACVPASGLSSPFSVGTALPRLRVPRDACDSHIHILDPRFPATPGWKGEPVNDATVAAYRAFQKRIGTSRVVVVTPSTYGDDNAATLDALRQFGSSARGVIVINSEAPPADLAKMGDAGVKGIRVNFVSPQPWGQSDARRLVETARIAADMGWHIQIFARAAQIADLEPTIAALPAPVVIDHLGYVPRRKASNTRVITPSCACWPVAAPGSSCPAHTSAAPSASRGMPTWRPSHKAMPRQRQSGWCGAVTGRIAARPGTCRTTPHSSTF